MVFSKSLAERIGLNEAIIVQQIRFACSQSKSGKMMGGHKWVWNTYEDWQSDWFPYLSVRTVKRTLQDLERDGYIKSCQPDGHRSRKKHYRVIEEKLAELPAEAVQEESLSSGQNGLFHGAKLARSITDKTQRAESADEKPSLLQDPKSLLTRPTQLPLSLRGKKA